VAVLRHQRAKRRRGNAGRGAAEAQRRSADSDAATGCCCRWAWAAVCAAEHPMAPPPLRARRVTGPRAPPTPGRQRPPRGGDSDRRTRPPHAKTHTASTRAARGHAQREQDGHTGLGDTRCQEKNTTSRSPQNAQGRAPIRLRTTGGSNGTRARACENIPANRRWQARPTGSAKIARVERRRVAARTKHHWARGVGAPTPRAQWCFVRAATPGLCRRFGGLGPLPAPHASPSAVGELTSSAGGVVAKRRALLCRAAVQCFGPDLAPGDGLCLKKY